METAKSSLGSVFGLAGCFGWQQYNGHGLERQRNPINRKFSSVTSRGMILKTVIAQAGSFFTKEKYRLGLCLTGLVLVALLRKAVENKKDF